MRRSKTANTKLYPSYNVTCPLVLAGTTIDIDVGLSEDAETNSNIPKHLTSNFLSLRVSIAVNPSIYKCPFNFFSRKRYHRCITGSMPTNNNPKQSQTRKIKGGIRGQKRQRHLMYASLRKASYTQQDPIRHKYIKT